MISTKYPGLIPSYEHERLVALQPYQVMSTPGQELFNDFVSIVAKLFDMPIALVSLVRAEDVVFIGNKGLPEALVVDREDSMCSVAILNDGLTEFKDVAAEPCALVNPRVAQQMHLGFYAGQALRTPNGQAVGSLCIIDRRPRELTSLEGSLLKELALVAQELLRLQAAQAANPTLVPELRARLEGPVQQSLTRLTTLAELRQWESSADTDEAQRYVESRLDEARYLAQTLYRELQAALTHAGQ
ncbi:GAF domain-containing protein [Hymenobacter sp. BT683]|uniref:GAF domain-containing protein n=1 Tax=Hymenobacter jeongseonensis TaxID=2791027 RepID=A0ABS0IHS4_9BACT|nr:GAF domain-containing protein [Hymenobacter jeongseonensis]MBF9237350.1 GAF domain-containing protein [Hymenobacter jeongseonensis]